MANLNLRSVSFDLVKSTPRYIVSSIVDCDWGHKGTKLIKSPEELNLYYDGIKEREGLVSLLENNSALLLKRLDRLYSLSPSLRLYNNDFKYSHPPVWDFNGYDTINTISPSITVGDPSEFVKRVNDYNQLTYSIEVDFSGSTMEDEDFIVLPVFDEGLPDYDNNLIVFFTDLNPTTGDIKFPNSFRDPVNPDELGGGTGSQVRYLGIDINNSDYLKRAEYIYNWYTSNLIEDFNLFNFTTDSVNDTNLIKDLCKLDGEKLTLVFSKPVRTLEHYKSNSFNPFEVNSLDYYNQELISKSLKEDAVISFGCKLEGNAEIDLNLKHIKGFEFEIEVSFGGYFKNHYVSIDRNSGLYQGETIFIEEVLDIYSDLIQSKVHLGTKIETGEFTVEDAKNLQGSYKLSYGRKGRDIPKYESGYIITDPVPEGCTNIDIEFEDRLLGIVYKISLEKEDSVWVTTYNSDSSKISINENTGEIIFSREFLNESRYSMAVFNYTSKDYTYEVGYTRVQSKSVSSFERSIGGLIESDIKPNLFIFNSERSREEQIEITRRYLNPNYIIGLYNFNDFSEDNIYDKLIPNYNREVFIYTLGNYKVLDSNSIIPNSYLYALSGSLGDFKRKIEVNKFPETDSDENIDYLKENCINYISSNKDGYYINYVDNLRGFLEPHYMFCANYVKTYISRFLYNNLGEFKENLEDKILGELPKVSSYSDLITSVNLDKLEQTSNNLTAVIKVSLSGMVGKSLDLEIKINK